MGLRPFFFLIFLLSIPLAAAAGSSVIFEKWASPGIHMASDGKNFSLVINEDSRKGFVIIDNLSIIVANSSCSSAGRVIACIRGLRESEIFDMQRFKFIYEVYLKISRTVPDIIFESETSKTTLNLGETAVSRLIFKNDGTEPATKIEITATMPNNVEIERVENCQINGGKITWAGELAPKESKVCEIHIIATASGTGNIKGDMFFNDGFQTKKSSCVEKLTVNDYLVMQASKFGNSTLNVTSEAPFTVTLTPKAVGFEHLNYRLFFPEGVVVRTYPEVMQKTEGRYEYEGSLEAKKNLTFRLRFDYIGANEISSQLAYSVLGVQHNLSKKYLFEVSGKTPKIQAVSPRIRNGRGQFQITNPTQSAFSNIEVTYTIEGHPKSQRFEILDRASYKEIEINYNGTSENVSVLIFFSFTTESGQRLESNDSLDLYVEKTTALPETIQTSGKPVNNKLVNNNIDNNYSNSSGSKPLTQNPIDVKKGRKLFLLLLVLFVILILFIGLIILSKIRKKL